jgi:5,6-dimethylbenzimidazole synthase
MSFQYRNTLCHWDGGPLAMRGALLERDRVIIDAARKVLTQGKERDVNQSAMNTAQVDTARYEALMDVVRNRMTNRAFAPCEIPREHYEMILEAARHAPSGANAQPWHYIVIRDAAVKQAISQYFVQEQQNRIKLQMKFPTPNYSGVATAPGVIAIAVDYRFVRAFPTLNDGSELDRMYRRNAERILLQSVAASTMSAHLAAAALGYAVWWITAIGQDEMQKNIRPLLAIPEQLDVVDVMCFGPPLKPSYKRWKKPLEQIVNWDRFNPENLMTTEQIEEWVKTRRHKVMYRDEANID